MSFEIFEIKVDKLPDCDLCKDNGRVSVARYDGRLRSSSTWACMCPNCWDKYGIRKLGTGFGQHLILKSERPKQTEQVITKPENLIEVPKPTKPAKPYRPNPPHPHKGRRA